ncbi:nose resistant to fluoxetine protein 6-like [Centruroides sculpturatus]|uniref:nose resistant to fluoxetine protein 6-like n=1 Tax=Centruroides sculpturatus TaxID=218467 RepID=UPI000C6EE7B1|nr:nose resistant to fluoxetine protein 6-like [Centruroides sculpturatus]
MKKGIVLFVLFLFIIFCKSNEVPEKEIENSTQNINWSELDKTVKFLNEAEKNYRNLAKSVVKFALPYLMKLSEETNLSSSCVRSGVMFMRDLTQLKEWPLQMLDSIGKFPSGFLRGTLWIQGDYDQCLDIEIIQNKLIRGKFCSVLMKVPKLRQETIQIISSSDTTIVQLLKNLSKPFSLFQTLSVLDDLRLDVCIPDSCSKNDLENIGNWLIRNYIQIEVEFCKTKEEKNEYSMPQLICLSVFGTLIICVILATSVHTLLKLQIVSKKRVNEKRINFSRIINYIPIEISYISFAFIESFFLISGLLTFYTRKQKAKSNMQYVQFIINRAIRLTLPVLCVLATMIILPLLGDGPHWEYVKREAEFAEQHWWEFAFHTHVYVNYPHKVLFHLWFISDLLQLTIITAPLLFVYDRWPKHGKFVIFMLLMVGITSHVTYMVMTDSFLFIGYSFDREKVYTYMFNNHSRPYYSHLTSYCTGLLIGNFLANKMEIKFKKIYRVIFWIISLSLLMYSTFGLHKQITEMSPNKTLVFIHRASSPFMWIIGLSWMCVACITGYGGVVNRFLSMKVFTILDRLNVWIYLLHHLIMFYIFAQLRKAATFTMINMHGCQSDKFR